MLLKNNGILPLVRGAKVAVIGDFAREPRYQGAGSSKVNPIQLESTLDIIGQYKLDVVGYAQGCKRYGQNSEKLAKEACELAKKADVILLYIGLDEVTESEGLDRESIDLPANQIELLNRLRACGKPIVAVLSCGCVLNASCIGGCSALVYGALGGQAGAGAVLDVLTGRENPSGKLSETWPMKLEDVPCYGRYPATERTSEYREGLYVGYRYYDTGGVPVRYPFGYGLSYTQFEYSDIAITEKAVSFGIKNTGSVAGGEIAQLYIAKPDAKIFRPAKELKGFVKVFLAPGEEKTVCIPFDDKTFRYFNVKTNRWEIEGGQYTLLVGASLEDIRLEAEMEIPGTDAPNPYGGRHPDHVQPGLLARYRSGHSGVRQKRRIKMKKDTLEKLEKKARYKAMAQAELETLIARGHVLSGEIKAASFGGKICKGLVWIWVVFQRLLKRIEVRWPLLKEFIVFWLLSNAVTVSSTSCLRSCLMCSA